MRHIPCYLWFVLGGWAIDNSRGQRLRSLGVKTTVRHDTKSVFSDDFQRKKNQTMDSVDALAAVFFSYVDFSATSLAEWENRLWLSCKWRFLAASTMKRRIHKVFGDFELTSHACLLEDIWMLIHFLRDGAALTRPLRSFAVDGGMFRDNSLPRNPEGRFFFGPSAILPTCFCGVPFSSVGKIWLASATHS